MSVCVKGLERGEAIQNNYSSNMIIGRVTASLARSRVRRQDLVARR